MRKIYKRNILPIILLINLIAILLSGCMNIQAEDLYALPRVSDKHLQLQTRIDEILNQGAELSPPIGGINRQAVQMVDLNGNGINEVIAFFSFPSQGTLSVYIFTAEDGDYSVAEVIEVVGTSFESVRYVDMDGDGFKEIIIGWQMGLARRQMEIFSIKDFHAVSLARSDYLYFIDFDITGTGNNDIIVVRPTSLEQGTTVVMYSLMPDGELIMASARLSGGVEMISRVLTGTLIDGTPAIFIDSEGRFADGNRMVTDIYIFRNNDLTNITIKGLSGISDETLRVRLNSADINGDGFVKVPIPRRLKAQSETPYYAIDWHTFNRNGYSTLALTTYHNNNDEWFLILPFDWRENVTIRREDGVAGERTVVFSAIQTEYEIIDFLRIHKITGDLREERAQLPGRHILITGSSAVYAFELLVPPNSFNLTFDETLVRNNFNLMHLG